MDEYEVLKSTLLDMEDESKELWESDIESFLSDVDDCLMKFEELKDRAEALKGRALVND